MELSQLFLAQVGLLCLGVLKLAYGICSLQPQVDYGVVDVALALAPGLSRDHPDMGGILFGPRVGLDLQVVALFSWYARVVEADEVDVIAWLVVFGRHVEDIRELGAKGSIEQRSGVPQPERLAEHAEKRGLTGSVLPGNDCDALA